MGIGPFRHSDSNSGTWKPTPPSPNPNPFKFKVIKSLAIGNYLVCKVNYPDCTTFEGNKVMVYENLTQADLRDTKSLDPHFFDDNKSPIARFRGDADGWRLAIFLATSLVLEE